MSPDHPHSPEQPAKPGLLRDFSLEKTTNSSKIDLKQLDQAALLSLRAEIDSKLTGIKLSDVNLEQETLIQYQQAKVLQIEASKEDSKVPMNQRAQVQNSLANLLTTLGKIQMELHDSESLKRLKAAVIRTVKAQDKPFQDMFFELLERELDAAETEMESPS
jgi:hypothetical protein